MIIDVEKERQTAEILLKTKMLDLTGKGQTDDMYNSIMLAIEKLERQALKHKSKIIEGKRQRAKAKSVANKIGVGEPAARILARRATASGRKRPKESRWRLKRPSSNSIIRNIRLSYSGTPIPAI